jgi:hypothetical protein
VKSFAFTIKDQLVKGLAPNLNQRNNPQLYDSVGAFPYDGVLQALTVFTPIDVSSLGTLAFPYPQLFVTSNFQIVCLSTAIYEYSVVGGLVSKISGLVAGIPWECLDFKDYVCLSNGQQTVTRDPVSGVYAVDTTIPFFTCACNFNGQVLVGTPNKAVSGNI